MNFPDITYGGEINKNNLKIANETYRFFLLKSDYHLNKKEQMQLKYLELLSSVDNPLKRMIYQMFGGLMKPERIFYLIIGTVVLFALLHLLPDRTFNVLAVDGNSTHRALSCAEAFYFSGISFTTIGYGDISPVGFSRISAVLEGFIGVVLSSSLLISFVKRYID